MRLKQIKLAGFKSFVDVTKIPFNQPLSAIIGPNGCGKSNVIDAVRWVLGESSAKHLRGDSMADVIFNGSSARRPVSVASVELLFDNQLGRLAGQYASYQEVAVKRQVSRDGDSAYFLNGQKCRRKDITDLFMGTGLGPRSYAIIEQGTISRLIESKPQELRVFIEEAAGISRYKERRRETENRIRHTRENLERLGDIRQELGRQIDKLAEQAQAAKQYRALKQTERTQDAELGVCRFVELQAQFDNLSGEIVSHELKKSELDAAKEALQREHTQLKVQLDELDQQEHRQVEDFYLTGTHIAKLEQSLKHRQQQDAHLHQRVEDTQAKLILIQRQLAELDERREQLSQHHQAAIDAYQQLSMQLEVIDEQLVEAEQGVEQDSEAHVLATQAQNQHQLTYKVAQTELSHSKSNLAQKSSQKAALVTQLSKLSQDDVTTQLQQLQAQRDELQIQSEQLNQSNQQLNSQLNELEQQDKCLTQQIDALSQSLAEERGRFNVVNRLLPVADADDGSALWQALNVTPGWEVAIDLALEGVLTQKVDAASGLGFVTTESHQWGGVSAAVNLAPWLAHLRWANELSSAQAMLPSIEQHERIVTADGYLIGHGFVLQKSEQGSALVQLKMEKEALTASIASSEVTLNTLRKQSQQCANQLLNYRSRCHDGAVKMQQMQLSLERMRSQIDAAEQRIAHSREQRSQLEVQLSELELTLVDDEQRCLALSERLAQDESRASDLIQQSERLARAQQESSAQLKRLKQQRAECARQCSQRQSALQTLQTDLALNQQQTQQLQQQISEHSASLASLKEQLEGKALSISDHSAQQVQQQLNAELEIQQSKQQALTALRGQQAHLQNQLDKIVTTQKQQLGNIEHLTQAISTLKLRREGIKGQADSQRALLAEHEINLEAVKDTLDVAITVGQHQKALERTRARIAQLGAINLAAIEEYEQQSERKHYLDSQDADLNKALNSLEEAIRKIDKETKTRFKETFDKVNQDLGILFPKVFGGGSAQLALTDDDLLETGVTIMARPPGKKNSTIHLLSGGEKALTALSLVFAIFRLNPAPFCMLDEVDAPLDDANVDRFCRLVKEMSQSVQFVYISHNKITMELADQLIGVTMHEPGVSRIVAVDIDEAVALADAG